MRGTYTCKICSISEANKSSVCYTWQHRWKNRNIFLFGEIWIKFLCWWKTAMGFSFSVQSLCFTEGSFEPFPASRTPSSSWHQGLLWAWAQVWARRCRDSCDGCVRICLVLWLRAFSRSSCCQMAPVPTVSHCRGWFPSALFSIQTSTANTRSGRGPLQHAEAASVSSQTSDRGVGEDTPEKGSQKLM